MKVSLRKPSTALGQYARDQVVRRRLIELGMDDWRVVAASSARLPELAREVEATLFDLVPDVEDAQADSVPRLGVKLSDEQRRINRHGESTPCELASLSTFATGKLLAGAGAWASADQFTPWDSFDGSDAA